MWSIGCILIELCTGGAYFRTPQDLEHLVMMEAMLGPLPRQIHTALQEALESKSSKQYISQERLIDIFMLDSVEIIIKSNLLIILNLKLQDLVMSHINDSANANYDLVDLLQRLLRYDPAERLKARDALTHPFFARY
ncbi:hypothetical protein ZIOFF_014609 [Zingiber officinale]|uniref:Protein kinase domain-containing protein n=2 Tax=Zingiber officinale TaxID=94328 RepID=A0A8J5HTE0_ZINOF|nr:hypothetical protein ZIOFF_014609 [Zingiber officinale]